MGRNKKGSSRAAATPLSRERIVQAALSLVNEQGLAAFSTRQLGQRLGCEAMSIYHHFASKQHLLDALVDHAITSVEVPEPGDDAIGRLRRCLDSYRAMARRWPGLFPLVATHRLNTPTGVRFIESMLRLIRTVEPDPELAARQFRAVGYYLIGACLDETAGYARGPSAAEPVSDEFIGRECPNLVAAAPYFQEQHWDATFNYGVDALVKGIAGDTAA
ncbi:MAG TPA: TetR family transcriptional regulator [Povalibacter sp.]|nr:TetR family transcriptional regulator [Povalibacter sp.]